MKLCRSCEQEKPEDAFGKWSKSPDGLYYKCKQCRSEYDKAHYASSPTRRAAVRAVDEKNRKENAQRVRDLKAASKCTDCGNRNPIVLEFDHLGDKKFNVADMVRHGRSWESIRAEIAKCDIVCANCHRIRTHDRRMAL